MDRDYIYKYYPHYTRGRIMSLLACGASNTPAFNWSECDNGLYGKNCSQKCPPCSEKHACNRTTGQCPEFSPGQKDSACIEKTHASDSSSLFSEDDLTKDKDYIPGTDNSSSLSTEYSMILIARHIRYYKSKHAKETHKSDSSSLFSEDDTTKDKDYIPGTDNSSSLSTEYSMIARHIRYYESKPAKGHEVVEPTPVATQPISSALQSTSSVHGVQPTPVATQHMSLAIQSTSAVYEGVQHASVATQPISSAIQSISAVYEGVQPTPVATQPISSAIQSISAVYEGVQPTPVATQPISSVLQFTSSVHGVQPTPVATQLMSLAKQSTSAAYEGVQPTPVATQPISSALQSTTAVHFTEVEYQVTNSTEMPQNEKTVDNNRPKRPCVYCGVFQSQLTRHIKRKHAEEEQVTAAVKLPKTEQQRAFDSLRKEGIFRKNVAMFADNPESVLLRERQQGASRVVMCGGCKGFYSKKIIKKHKKYNCPHDCSLNPDSIEFSRIPAMRVPPDFQDNILNHFRDDEVGRLCCIDKLIVLVGQKLWAKSLKRERRCIMSDMRLLGNLLMETRKVCDSEHMNGESLLDRANFDALTTAITNLSTRDNQELKSGIRLSLGFLLKKTIKVMKGYYIQINNEEKAKEVDRFAAVFDLNWDYIFYSAQLQCEQRRTVLRKPMDMPLEEDICRLRNYVIARMQSMLEDRFVVWDYHYFVELRNLIVTRLTLFNARRGGEPARLTVQEWEEAIHDQWIDMDLVHSIQDPMEKALVGKFKLAYQAGKGSRKLVPVLIPNDTLTAIQKLVSERKNCIINENNMFLFPNTGGSIDHVLGYNCVRAVVSSLTDLRKPNLLIADKFRHRASTLFALQDVSGQERQTWYKHMGHSAEVNQNVYQCPLAISEMTKVGGFLTQLDQHGKNVQTLPNGLRAALFTEPSSVESIQTDHIHKESPLPATMTATKLDLPNRATQQLKGESTMIQNLSASLESHTAITSGTQKQPSKKRNYFQWNTEDAQKVCAEFKLHIECKGSGTKGPLPGMKTIAKFLNSSELFSKSNMCEKRKIDLVKAKIFNERKKFRSSAENLFEVE